MENEGPPVTFLDNAFAPEVFSTRAVGFFFNEGNVHITFESVRINHVTTPGPVNRVVIGRVVMPLAGAQSLAVGLFDFLKTQGLAPDLTAEVKH